MTEQETALRLELIIAIRELVATLKEFTAFLKEHKEVESELER